MRNHNYQLHDRKKWPYGIHSGTYWDLTEAIKWAIDQNIRFISKDKDLLWENPYFRKGVVNGSS